MNSENLMNIQRLTVAKRQVLKPREWTVVLRGTAIFLQQSRLVDFWIQALQFSLIVAVLFLDNDFHRIIIVSSLFLSIPSAIVDGVDAIIGLGQTLAITDADFLYTWNCLISSRVFAWCCRKCMSVYPHFTRQQRRDGLNNSDREIVRRTPWVYPYGYDQYYSHCLRVLRGQGPSSVKSMSSFETSHTLARESKTRQESSIGLEEGFQFSMEDYVDEQLKDPDDPLTFTTRDGSTDNACLLTVPEDAYTENPMMKKKARPTIKRSLKPRKVKSRTMNVTPPLDSSIERLDESELRMTTLEHHDHTEEQNSDEEDGYDTLPALSNPTKRASKILLGAAGKKAPKASLQCIHVSP